MIRMNEAELLAALDFVPIVRCDSEKAGGEPHNPAAWFATIHECKLPGKPIDPAGTYDAAMCPACVLKVRGAFEAATKLGACAIPGHEPGVQCAVCSRVFTDVREFLMVTGPIKQAEGWQ